MNFKPEFEKKNLHEANYELIEKYMVPLNHMTTFKPDQSIHEAIATILDKKISGAPVLDEHRHLVGNLSEKDCLRIIVDHATTICRWRTRKFLITCQLKFIRFRLQRMWWRRLLNFSIHPSADTLW